MVTISLSTKHFCKLEEGINMTHFNIKAFSHNDLDGYAATAIIKKYFNEPNQWYNMEHCDNTEIDKAIQTFVYKFITKAGTKRKTFPKHLIPNMIFVTDIVITNKSMELLLKLCSIITSIKFVYVDHHPQSDRFLIHNNKYKNVTIVVDSSSVSKHCATDLVHSYLQKQEGSKGKDNVSEFVEIVRLWDTWDWKNGLLSDDPNIVHLSTLAQYYNLLFYKFGPANFYKNQMMKFIENATPEETEIMIALDIKQESQKYIQSKLKNVMKRSISLSKDEEYVAGVVFAERDISELGNSICENNPDVDCAIIINTNSVPFKVSGRSVMDSVNMTKIMSKLFNGGGHPKASGGTLTEKQMMTLNSLLFS